MDIWNDSAFTEPPEAAFTALEVSLSDKVFLNKR